MQSNYNTQNQNTKMEMMIMIKEPYSFNDYVEDFELLNNKEATLKDLKVLWDVYEDDYIDYCEENNYDSEAFYAN